MTTLTHNQYVHDLRLKDAANRSASGPKSTYRTMIKQAIDSHAKGAKVTDSPSPVRWTNKNVVVVESAPAETHTAAIETPSVTIEVSSPNPVKVEPIPAPAELSPAERGEVFMVPMLKMGDYIQEHPEYGYPKKGDSFHIVTLTDNKYNGFALPLGNNPAIYPVYLVANQNGELMQTCNDDDWTKARKESPARVPVLGWYFRNCTAMDSESALNLALRDIKRLKTWVNWTYGKVPTESPDEIRLSVRKTDDSTFQVLTDTLKRAIKDVNKNAWIEFSGMAFPAKPLQEIVKLADDTVINVTLDQAYTYQVIKWAILNKGTLAERQAPDGLIDKTSPALILRHGSTKTVIYGATLATLTGKDSDALVIHCTLLG